MGTTSPSGCPSKVAALAKLTGMRSGLCQRCAEYPATSSMSGGYVPKEAILLADRETRTLGGPSSLAWQLINANFIFLYGKNCW
jgi:hypothetical protein